MDELKTLADVIKFVNDYWDYWNKLELFYPFWEKGMASRLEKEYSRWKEEFHPDDNFSSSGDF